MTGEPPGPPFELRVRCAGRDAVAVGEALTARGWGTLWVEEPLVQGTDDDGYVLDEPPPDAPAVVHAYPTREGDSPAVPEGVLGFAVERVALEPAATETDWATAWREGHAARVEVLAGWSVIAPWGEPLAGERAIVIEPGGAFGTGEHPTTLDSLRALRERLCDGASVLDLGTGSGVLAIAAVLWGAGDVAAVDIQDDAPECVAANAALNGIARGRIEVRVADAADAGAYAAGRRWDVVLCNVGSAEVERVIAIAAEILAPGGALVASGVFAPSRARVESAAERAGLRADGAAVAGEWVTLAWRAAP